MQLLCILDASKQILLAINASLSCGKLSFKQTQLRRKQVFGATTVVFVLYACMIVLGIHDLVKGYRETDKEINPKNFGDFAFTLIIPVSLALTAMLLCCAYVYLIRSLNESMEPNLRKNVLRI